MTDVVLRPADTDDAAGWADVVDACSPYLVQDARSTAHTMASDVPERSHRLVATVGGRVIGVARMRDHAEEPHVAVQVMVRPGWRRAGHGRRLLDLLTPRVVATGKATVTTIVEDDGESAAAAAAWGFRTTRTFRMSAVDPRTVTAVTPVPAGVGVCPLADLGPHRIWEAHTSVARDDPSGLSVPVPFAEFLDEWEDPRARPDLGRAALVDGELAAFTLLFLAGDRASSDMTGTLPAFRGRGLARLVKEHGLRAAAAAGVTRCITGNDAANLPMVRVNDRLGYRPFAAPALAERPVRPTVGGSG